MCFFSFLHGPCCGPWGLPALIPPSTRHRDSLRGPTLMKIHDWRMQALRRGCPGLQMPSGERYLRKDGFPWQHDAKQSRYLESEVWVCCVALVFEGAGLSRGKAVEYVYLDGNSSFDAHRWALALCRRTRLYSFCPWTLQVPWGQVSHVSHQSLRDTR